MSEVFFADRNLGRQLPLALREAGLDVHLHDEHFGERTSDEEWLALAGRRHWIVLSMDQRIRYKPNELQAVIAHRVRMLVFIGKARHVEHRVNLLNTLVAVEAFFAERPGPLIAKLYRPSAAARALRPESAGRVEEWYPKAA